MATVHDMIQELRPELFQAPGSDELRRRKKQCIESADLVICVSKSTSHDLQEVYGIPRARIRVIYNGYSKVFRQLGHNHPGQATDTTERPFLLYIGSRAPYKGFDHLLQAFSTWRRSSDVQLVIVGAPLTGAETERLGELQLLDRVKTLSGIDDQQLCMLYNQSSALVHPSSYEGFGIPLLEAMACGCPVVASRIPSTLEVAGDCPVYFEPAEPEDLATALDTVIDEGRMSNRVRAGIARVESFSWTKAAEETLHAYRYLV